MGHRSCIVCHRSTTLPGAPSIPHIHRCLGCADKKRALSRSPRLPTTYVIILEGRRPGGSIGAIFQSIVHFLLLIPRDNSIVRLFQPILILHRFDELYDRVRERPTAGPINRSPWSTTTISVFEARSGKSINEFVELSVRGQACTTGISNEYRTCKSISEFEAHSRVFERTGGSLTNNTVAANVERSFGSILILWSIVGFTVESIRFIKLIQQKDSRINRFGKTVDFKKPFPIIIRLYFIFHRLSNERTIIRVKHVSIFLGTLSELVNQFFQPAILKVIDSYEIIHSSFSSRKSLIHVATPFRAAMMTSGRRMSFR